MSDSQEIPLPQEHLLGLENQFQARKDQLEKLFSQLQGNIATLQKQPHEFIQNSFKAIQESGVLLSLTSIPETAKTIITDLVEQTVDNPAIKIGVKLARSKSKEVDALLQIAEAIAQKEIGSKQGQQMTKEESKKKLIAGTTTLLLFLGSHLSSRTSAQAA